MRSAATILSAAALVGYAAAAPAPQQIDIALFASAPAVTLTGPPLTVATQVVTINTAAIVASISQQATTVATAAITGAAASAAANLSPNTSTNSKRGLQERSLISQLEALLAALGLNKSQTTSTTAKTTSTTSTAKATSTTSSAVATSTSTSSAKSTSSSLTSSYFTSLSLTSTTTTNQGSASSTTSSSTACPTVPEAGTYCGFINPEDPCAPQPDGYGPTVTPDTVDAFMSYAPFQSMATNAPTPSGYARTFTSYNASSSATSYLGLYTLTSYDTASCAAHCDNTSLCTAFNIYIERDPSQNPTANDSTADTVWGYWCPNPASITNYKCTLWGSGLDATTATNGGGWREQFQVAIVGSNGYDKTNNTTPAVVPAYDPPTNCSSQAIDGGNYHLGGWFHAGAFDPSLCASYASAQAATNKQAAIAAGKSSYTPCNMFNAYHLYKNGKPQGTYCSLYDTALSPAWATVSGTRSGNDVFSCRNSWTYKLTNQDSGKC